MGPAERDPNLVEAPMWTPDTGWKTKKKKLNLTKEFIGMKTPILTQIQFMN